MIVKELFLRRKALLFMNVKNSF